MSPRKFDPGVVQSRVGSMYELLNDLGMPGMDDATRIRADRLMRHAVERILIALVDHAVKINSHVVGTARAGADQLSRIV